MIIVEPRQHAFYVGIVTHWRLDACAGRGVNYDVIRLRIDVVARNLYFRIHLSDGVSAVGREGTVVGVKCT